MTPGLVLGIDGGGTSTTAWLADADGSVLGRGLAGPSNLKAIGPEAACAALGMAVVSAFEDAGLEPRSAEVACLGLAGFDRPEEKRLLEVWSTAANWAGRLVLVNDGDLVVAAGTAEGWGVGVIAGTGSIAVGRTRDGRTARAGGWGYLLGDEGSGYAVALAGLRKVARRADGRESIASTGDDRLTRAICDRLGIDGPASLVSAIYRPDCDRARIASLAPAVVKAAEIDRTIVDEILRPAGLDLGAMILAVARSLEFAPGPLPVARAGSFLLNCPIASAALAVFLAGAGYEVIATDVREPVAGALILALRALPS